MYINQILKIISLLDKRFKLKLLIVILLMLFLSTLELVGIGVLAGFIYFLVDIDKFLLKLPDLEITDYVINLENDEKIKLFIILIIIIFLLKNFLIFISNIYFYKFNRQLNIHIVARVLQKYLKSEYSFFLENKISKIINNVRDETTRFCGIIMSYLNIFKELVLIILIIAGIITINWKITLGVFLFIFSISMLIIYFLRLTLIKLGEQRTLYSSKIYKNLYDIFFGIKFIKIKFLENVFLKKITKVYSSLLDVMFRQSVLILIPRLMLEVMGVTGLCIIIYIFLLLDYSFNEIIPLLTFLALVIIRMVPSMAALNQNINNISSNNISFELISSLIEGTNTEFDLDKKDDNTLERGIEEIESLELKNICFGYDEQVSNTLDNINLKIYKNDILGIIGKSGSGKTTLVNLILGLLKPKIGKILINGKENEDLKKYEISYVPQDVSILDEDIYSNIAYGIKDEDVDKETIEKLIEVTQLDKQTLDISKNLGESGLNISGGQKQRIGFARGLYGKFSLIALDEPTSDLDYETQKRIIKYLENSSKSRITILVAHRLDTLNICNKIAIIEQGKIKDFDFKEKIIENNPYLKKYLEN